MWPFTSDADTLLSQAESSADFDEQAIASLTEALHRNAEHALIAELHRLKAEDISRYEAVAGLLRECERFCTLNHERRKNMFGYPGNLADRSYFADFFRRVESLFVLSNNCGDIYSTSSDPGNHYAMDSKRMEWEIVRCVADNLSLPPQPSLDDLTVGDKENGYWGYVTSGGSESNSWGITQGFQKYENGIFYFCRAAHYSVPKAAKCYESQMISQNSADDESINVSELLDCIETQWKTNQKPAILLLTAGTTRFGSIDDVAAIKAQLRQIGVPHYLHIDAALYGGIPKHSDCAPLIGSVEDWGYDSISVSLHKYIGYPNVKSVLISVQRPTGERIEYVGQVDNTVAGSRDIQPFSMLQQVRDTLVHSSKDDYIRNIKSFGQMLNDSGIKSVRSKNGNIFVFRVNKDSERYQAVCDRWQLSEFQDMNGGDRVHVIIFPHHSIQDMKNLVIDLRELTRLESE